MPNVSGKALISETTEKVIRRAFVVASASILVKAYDVPLNDLKVLGMDLGLHQLERGNEWLPDWAALDEDAKQELQDCKTNVELYTRSVGLPPFRPGHQLAGRNSPCPARGTMLTGCAWRHWGKRWKSRWSAVCTRELRIW